MLTEILEKYRDKKPMDFGIATEVVYPVSSVIRMMEEYHNCKVNELRLGGVIKSVCCGELIKETSLQWYCSKCDKTIEFK